jgi:hypothetical protein
MSGTLPHELSMFSESLKSLNFGGNSLTGTIPPSFTKITNLKSLVLSDNCFTSKIHKGFVEIPSLEIFSFHNNNYGLTPHPGDMGKLCDGNGGRRDGVVAVTMDCPPEEFEIENDDDNMDDTNSTKITAPWGCDCCICCSPEKYECQELSSGAIWPSVFKDGLSQNGYVKGFDTKCVTTEQEDWIAINCPCMINVSIQPVIRPFVGQCTTDCMEEGAIPTYDFGG